MVIFDPFQAFLGAGVDMFRSNETRPELAKLFEMCERPMTAPAQSLHTLEKPVETVHQSTELWVA